MTMLRLLLPALAPGLTTNAAAQTRSARDTVTAYGARLTAQGQPANRNGRRVNSRIPSRLDNRLSLRIERYRVDATADPTAAYRTGNDDRSRNAPVVALPPPPNIDAEQP